MSTIEPHELSRAIKSFREMKQEEIQRMISSAMKTSFAKMGFSILYEEYEGSDTQLALFNLMSGKEDWFVDYLDEDAEFRQEMLQFEIKDGTTPTTEAFLQRAKDLARIVAAHHAAQSAISEIAAEFL